MLMQSCQSSIETNPVFSYRLEDYIAIHFATGRSKSTLKNLRDSVHVFSTFSNLENINDWFEPMRVQNEFLRIKKEKHWKDSTYNSHRKNLMAYFEFLKKNWEIPRNPIVGVSPCTNTPTDQDAISEKDVRKVLRYLEENKFGINRLTRLRNSLIIHILALVWCRPSELLNTNLDSFEKNRTSLRIRNGKWVGKTRAFSLDYKTQELVRGYIQEAAFCGRSKELEKHFFLWTKKWQGLSYNGFRIMCNKLSEKMGMRIYSYMFRRYAISFLYESNVPLQNIQHLAGHTRQSTTLRYIQATPEMNDKAIALLANSING